MGEDALQRFIAELLRPLVAKWLATSGRRTFVGADQFLYFVEGDPKQRVAPDVYVMPGVDPGLAPPCWKLWELDAPPSFALEIVSQNHRKDYEKLPPVYGRIGVRELVIFDPRATARSRVRVRWQVWRREGARGWKLVERSMADRIESRELGCWLRAVGDGSALRLRLAIGRGGDSLLPTDAELAETEHIRRAVAEAQAAAERLARQQAEQVARDVAERANTEARRANTEAERAARETQRAAHAEAELARVQAELARLRGG